MPFGSSRTLGRPEESSGASDRLGGCFTRDGRTLLCTMRGAQHVLFLLLFKEGHAYRRQRKAATQACNTLVRGPPPKERADMSWTFFFFFFKGRSCLQKTGQGRNAGMQNLGKGASPEEEGR